MQDIVPQKRKAVFLDRDGVINEEVNYAHRRDQLILIPRAGEAIRLLNDHGFLVIVVTNQAGIARGLYEEKDMHAFHRALEEELKKENNARADAIYWCPHHPEGVCEAQRMNCDCRKPNSGMILRARQDFDIDLAASFIVGDKWSDVQAGRNAGCKTILVRTGQGAREFAEKKNQSADHYAADIFEAVQFILREG